MSLSQQSFTPVTFSVRCTSESLLINNELVNYSEQALHMDKLYIVKPSSPTSKLKTPLILERTSEIDDLDRRVFVRRFVFELVKGLEICSMDDAIFIIKRVPKFIKYFVGVTQGISLGRWKELLASNKFFVEWFGTLEELISKKPITKLKQDYIEELLDSKLKNTHERMFYLLQTLVLEDENLRNSLLQLTRNIVLQQLNHPKFFEKYLLNHRWSQQPIDEENSILEDNRSVSSAETLAQQDKEMAFPQKLLRNVVNVVRSCQKLKIDRQAVSTKIMNVRFFKILKMFFQAFFERQRPILIEVLAQASEIQPLLLWTVTFEEGRTTRCKNLKMLELLLTNSMVNYVDSLKRGKKSAKFQLKQGVFTKYKNPQIASNSTVQGLTDLQKQRTEPSWQLVLVILEKFISFPSPQRKAFLSVILNSLLNCKLIVEELEYILIFLESSLQDEKYIKKNVEIWQMVVGKIEGLLKGKVKERKKENDRIRRLESSLVEDSGNMSERIEEEAKYESCPTSKAVNRVVNATLDDKKRFKRKDVRLPFSKPVIIYLMKVYKLLVGFEKKFDLMINQECLEYLLEITEQRKGVIEGVRLTLIEAIGKERSEGEISRE